MTTQVRPQGTSLAPFIMVAAIAAALIATSFRWPGALVLLLGLTASAWFATPAQATGAKGSDGSVAPATPKEARAIRHWRVWSDLRWKLFVPNTDWLVNRTDQWNDFGISGKFPAAVTDRLPWIRVLGDMLGHLLWLLLPARFVTVVAAGAFAIVVTLPTDRLDPGLVWLNAAAAAILVIQLDASIRRQAAAEDPSPGVPLAAIASRDKRNIIAIVAGAGMLAAGAWLTIMSLGLDWLIVPWPVTTVGIFIASGSAFLHLYARAGALQPWRNTVAARAAWRPRWEALKQSPRLIKHERIGDDEIPVDTFEAPGLLGSAGAIALQAKMLPFMGSGTRIAFLNSPDVDSDGQPVDGTKHPSRFRVMTWQSDHFPRVADPATPHEVVAALLESAVHWALETAHQFQPVLLSVRPIAEAVDEHSTMAYASTWTLTEAMAASALAAGKGDIAETLRSEAYVDDPDGESTLYFGAVTDDTTSLTDPALLDRLEELSVEARWDLRWEDLLKVGEKRPVIQYAARKSANLTPTTVIESMPFMVKQGLDPAAFFNPYIAKRLPTTLAGAPFVTVTGYAAAGLRPGDRHPQALTVIWSHKPVPASPSDIPPSAEKQAQVWAIAGTINDAFDAARLARPEVVAVKPLTHKDGFTHIWKITLRLYDGVTAAMVKLHAEKLRLSMGGCAWLRVTESIDGCDIYAGADPKNPQVEWASPKKQNKDACIALDWEQAFIDAKVVSPADGSAPKLVKADTLPTNEKVQRLEFTIPRGLAVQNAREQRAKLIGATGNAFIEVRSGLTPETFTLLACVENPMPFPARFDWQAIADTTTIPFATGIEGEPIEYDIGVDPHLLILGGTGSGKAQPLDTRIPVPASERFPDGWATNAELDVGDHVFGANGQTTEIIGFTRTRAEPSYILTLDDGQQVSSSGHHLWPVTDRGARKSLVPSRRAERVATHDAFIRRAAALRQLAETVGPEVGASVKSIANLAGVPAHTIYTSGAAPRALARLVLERTKKRAAVYEMSSVIAYLHTVIGTRGAFVICGKTLSAEDVDDLELSHAWLSVRGVADALLGRASNREERQAAKQVVRRARAASRPGFERRLVPFYPTDEVLTRLADHYAAQAGHHTQTPATILTTEEMFSRTHTGSGHTNFAIDVPAPLNGETRDLPIPPYLLGAWLGDGSSAGGGITVGGEYIAEMTALLTAEWTAPHRIEYKRGTTAQTLHFGRRHPELCEHGRDDRMPSGGCRPHDVAVLNMSLGRALGQLGVTTAHGGKRIPAAYRRASLAQRLALLQGIMDTDGTIGKSGNCELTLCNEALSNDCLELIRSLGIKASMSSGPAALTEADPGSPGQTRRRVVGTRWRIKFTTTEPVFRLAAKAARLPHTVRSTTKNLYVTGIRAEGIVAQRCIRVAGPEHTYLTGGFVPTHNSAALQDLLTVAIMRGWDVYLADPIKLAADFRYAEPWVKSITIDELETSAMMDYVYAEVQRRKALNGEYKTASYRDLPPEVRPQHVAIIIDEFTSLMVADALHKPDSSASEKELHDFAALQAISAAKRNIGAKAARIVREARSVGVTLILAAQELKAETLKAIPGGGSLKGNMSSLILGRTSFGSLMSALKDPVAAQSLLEGTIPLGRGIFESSKSAVAAIQVWYDEHHVASMTGHIAAVRPPLTSAQKADLIPFLPAGGTGPVFGEKIAPADDDDELIDLGEVDDLGIDFDALPSVTGEEPDLVLEEPGDAARPAANAPLGSEILSELLTEAVLLLGEDLQPDLVAPLADDRAVLWFSDDHGAASVPRAASREFGWWKLDDFAALLNDHHEIRRVVWVDPELEGVDEIGVPHAAMAEDIARHAGVQLHVIALGGDSAADELAAARAALQPTEREAVAPAAPPLLDLFPDPVIVVPPSTVTFE